MLILAFESSAKAASTALLEDGRLLAEYTQNAGQTHSVTLMKMAQDMLKNCEKTPQDVTAVAVAAGPGSFTGVRIGVAAAKGFAWGRKIPCYGVSTLEAMALGAGMCDGVYCCVMDARREQVYHGLFEIKDGTLHRLCPDCAISIEELQERLKKIENTIFLVGDGANLCYNTLRLGNLHLLPEHLRQQGAAGVALAAQKKIEQAEPGSAYALSPTYLRLSQAERERLEKQKNSNQKG